MGKSYILRLRRLGSGAEKKWRQYNDEIRLRESDMIYKTKQGKLTSKDIKLKELEAKLRRAGCDPVSIQIWIAMADAKKLGVEPTIKTIDKQGNVTERPSISIEVRQKAVTELMDRIYPKLKAIEHTGEISAVAEQRLTADEIKSILVDDPFLKAKEIVIDERRGNDTPTEKATGNPSRVSGVSENSSETGSGERCAPGSDQAAISNQVEQ